jgi:prepilin-type N-terminal cleavage/methylation domain-containing protein
MLVRLSVEIIGEFRDMNLTKRIDMNSKKGFTLIEIVIVLAIAALIILIVLLAVGGAQRTRRDTTRTSNAGTLASALDAYASNTNGDYPGSASFLTTYAPNLKDPITGAAPSYATGAATLAVPFKFTIGSICSGGATTTTGAGARHYAITWWSENAGASQCRDNK